MTSKSLPSDPTPEMMGAARIAHRIWASAEPPSFYDAALLIAYRAAWDASPPLKRTDSPSTPGWYWIRWGESEAGDAFPAMVYRDGARLLCAATIPPCPVDQLQFFGRLPDGEVSP